MESKIFFLLGKIQDAARQRQGPTREGEQGIRHGGKAFLRKAAAGVRKGSSDSAAGGGIYAGQKQS